MPEFDPAAELLILEYLDAYLRRAPRRRAVAAIHAAARHRFNRHHRGLTSVRTLLTPSPVLS